MEPSAPWFLLACLCLLSSVLLPSAVGKFRDWRGFVAGVVAYQVGPPFLARAFGWALPLLESLLLVGLWWTPLRAVSSLALLMLLLLFMGAVVVNLRRGSTAPVFVRARPIPPQSAGVSSCGMGYLPSSASG